MQTYKHLHARTNESILHEETYDDFVPYGFFAKSIREKPDWVKEDEDLVGEYGEYYPASHRVPAKGKGRIVDDPLIIVIPPVQSLATICAIAVFPHGYAWLRTDIEPVVLRALRACGLSVD